MEQLESWTRQEPPSCQGCQVQSKMAHCPKKPVQQKRMMVIHRHNSARWIPERPTMASRHRNWVHLTPVLERTKVTHHRRLARSMLGRPQMAVRRSLVVQQSCNTGVQPQQAQLVQKQERMTSFCRFLLEMKL